MPNTKPFVPPRVGGTAFRVVDLDFDGWTKMNMIIYGQPGVGKTTLAASAALVEQMSPVLVIDSSGGTRTLQGKPQYKGKVKVLGVTYFEGYNDAYAYVVEHIREFKTIIIDDISMVWQQAMDFEMERVVASDPNREIGVPSQREYGICRNMLHKLVRYFIGLPHNLIITCHADWDKDDITQQQKIRPAIPGKLAHELPGLMNVVGYMAMKRILPKGGPGQPLAKKEETAPATEGGYERTIFFQPKNYEVKDTSDSLGPEMGSPTMAKIAEKIGLREPDFESFYATANFRPKTTNVAARRAA